VVTIDVLALYTAQAASENGGTSGAQNMITAATALANTALKNSKVNAQIRVVSIQKISHTEGTGVSDDLDALTNGSTPALAQVKQLRLQSKADLVTLFTGAHGASSVGVAWLMDGQSAPDYGYSVVELQATTGHTFMHEMGHNLGCNHTKDAGGNGAFAYSYGHRFVPTDSTAPSSQYRTVMAYAPGVRVPYFSNPTVRYFGTPTGVTDSEDNARTINQTAAIIAAYSDSLK
jgi:predicted Zn-dependent protease with MMP-like domain